ncbi:hypothetical protein L3X38_039700 [Prunus dulcis]|uniref:Uncharacterized protein n=1 Tax=Prunus dulcis TaxID=3755 RepID=A0AAD4V951_PRUDU|nr:hypothetical protein L3X38_039700 [Prunus dulcis]
MMTNYEDRDYDAKEGRSRVEKCVIRDHMILNKKGEDSGVNPSVTDTTDLSNATRKEARRAYEPYADEAIELLRTTISQRWVEVELQTIDEDGYFVGYLSESNTMC